MYIFNPTLELALHRNFYDFANIRRQENPIFETKFQANRPAATYSVFSLWSH